MDRELLRQGEKLLSGVEKINKFSSKFEVLPVIQTSELVNKFYVLSESIPLIEVPSTREEVFLSELKRSLFSAAKNGEMRLSGKSQDLQSILDVLCIPKEDIDNLKPWLLENKEKTMQTIDSLFHENHVDSYQLVLPVDVPNILRQAEGFISTHIEQYHIEIGRLIAKLTSVGDYLRDIKAVPTTGQRSYFSSLTNTMAISMPNICFMDENGSLQIRKTELIRIYGHEGMGHGLQDVVTKQTDIPGFLKRPQVITSSCQEAIAQFYQNRLFKDIHDSKEVQKKLDIAHNYFDIFKDGLSFDKLSEYRLKLFYYEIIVLADKSLGEVSDAETIKRKKEILSEVALDVNNINSLVESNRYNYDSDGNLSYSLMSELRYCSRPVDRVLEVFKNHGINYEGKDRTIIDETLLTGYWSSQGILENARVVAKEYAATKSIESK